MNLQRRQKQDERTVDLHASARSNQLAITKLDVETVRTIRNEILTHHDLIEIDAKEKKEQKGQGKGIEEGNMGKRD